MRGSKHCLGLAAEPHSWTATGVCFHKSSTAKSQKDHNTVFSVFSLNSLFASCKSRMDCATARVRPEDASRIPASFPRATPAFGHSAEREMTGEAKLLSVAESCSTACDALQAAEEGLKCSNTGLRPRNGLTEVTNTLSNARVGMTGMSIHQASKIRLDAIHIEYGKCCKQTIFTIITTIFSSHQLTFRTIHHPRTSRPKTSSQTSKNEDFAAVRRWRPSCRLCASLHSHPRRQCTCIIPVVAHDIWLL